MQSPYNYIVIMISEDGPDERSVTINAWKWMSEM